MKFFGDFGCGAHKLSAEGALPTYTGFDFCPNGPGATLTIPVIENRPDYGTSDPAVWTLVGHGRYGTITTRRPNGQMTGRGYFETVTDQPTNCYPDIGVAGQAVLYRSNEPQRIPAVVLCQATGRTDGMMFYYDDQTGKPYEQIGTSHGHGTCTSSLGASTLFLTGRWDQRVPCARSTYLLELTLKARGVTARTKQVWSKQTRSPTITIYDSNEQIPLGGGTMTEQPNPCSKPATIGFSAQWVFVQM